MALPSSGAISLNAVNVELGLTATAQISLNDSSVRSLFGVASGAISLSNGYGLSSLPSFAPFVGGAVTNSSTATAANQKYLFSNDSVTSGTSYPVTVLAPVASGNTTTVCYRYVSTRYLYSYSGDAWTAGLALPTVSGYPPSTYGGSISSKTIAYDKVDGAATGETLKYTYSTATSSAGTTLTYACAVVTCVGNSTKGLFGGGYIGSTNYTTTSKYTYSNDTTAAGTNLTIGRFWMTGTGISTAGYYCGGYAYNGGAGVHYSTIMSYTYSNDTVSNANNLAVATAFLASGGSTTKGIIAGGNTDINSLSYPFSANTSKYTYSANTVASGGSLTTPRSQLAGPGATPAAI